MMTNDKKARLLALYRENALEMQRLDRELEAHRQRTEALRHSVSVTPEAAGVLRDYGAALLERLAKATRERAAAERCIGAAEDVRHRTLLALHYLDGLTWEKTAEAMGYDIRYVFRLREKALAAVTPPEI